MSDSQKEKLNLENTRKLNKIKRKNAKLFPIYKMFSWDLLFFYSIEFLFYTIAKKLTASEILMINGALLFFKIFMQIPAIIIADRIGKKKSIVLGNISLIFYITILIYMPGALSVIIADIFLAFGSAIKTITEPGLLYDSVSTKGGEGLYSKIESKGGSLYYVLDGIASLMAGYLFVMNNYIPMYICFGFILISTILSFMFKDIYKPEKPKDKKYFKDVKDSFKFAFRSNRMKSIILFNVVFYGLISLIVVYKSDLLVNIGVPEEQFSIIFAALSLIGGLSISLKDSIEKRFKNRTLTFISLTYVFACIAIGVIATKFMNKLSIPFIIGLLALMQCCESIWYIFESKYTKNFTTENTSNKVTFAYEFIGGCAASIVSFLGGLLLDHVDIRNGFLIVGLIALMFTVLVLDYMRKRFGLKPEEYSKKDLEFEGEKK